MGSVSFLDELAARLEGFPAGKAPLLVVPTLRFQRYLTDRLLARTGAQAILLPPMIVYGEVLREVSALQGKPALSSAGALALLRQVLAGAREHFGALLPEHYLDTLPKFEFAGRTLLDFFNEIHSGEVALAQLARHVLYTDMERHLAALTIIDARLRSSQAENGFCLPSFLYAGIEPAQAEAFFRPWRQVWLIAPGALTAVEQRVFRAGAKVADICIQAPEGETWPVGEFSPPLPDRPLCLANVRHMTVSGLAEQSAAVVGVILAALDAGEPAHRIAVVNTDPTFTILAWEQLTAMGVPVNLSVGLPARQHPLFQFLELGQAWVREGFPYRRLLDLLRNPFFRRLLSEGSWPALYRFETVLEENAVYHFDPAQPPARALAEAAAPESPAWVDQFLEALRFISRLAASATVQELTTNLQVLFARLGDFNDARFRLLRRTCEEALMEMVSLERCGFDDFKAGALAPYLHWLGQKPVTELGNPFQGVQLLGLLETRGLDFDTVIVPSFNEGYLPVPPTGNLFLNNELRRRVGLPTAHRHEALQELYLARLCAGARRAVLISIRDDTGSYGPASRWGRGLNESSCRQPLPAAVFPLPCSGPPAGPPVLAASLSPAVRQRAGTRFSRLALQNLRDCEIRFLLQQAMGLGRAEGLPDEVERADVGSLVHSALRDVYRSAAAGLISGGQLHHLLDARLDSLLRAESGKWAVPAPDAPIAAAIIRERLHAFLDWDSRRLEQKHRRPYPELIEAELDVVLGSFRIYGRIDRVDQDAGGAYHVVDYKTGTLPSTIMHTRQRRYAELQLSLYGFLLRRGRGVAAIGSLSYIQIGRQFSEEIIIKDDVEGHLDDFEEFLTELLTKYQEAEQLVLTEDIRVCKRCAFDPVCRIAERGTQ